MSRPTQYAGIGTVLAAALVAALLIAEVVARYYYPVSPVARFDEQLGWQGWKSFGDPQSKRTRVLVLGDSFTVPLPGLDPELLYYRVLGEQLGVEIFAYGAPGFGTLQELLVLERYLREVRPDLVLLQVTSNDFINNSWEMERASYFNNNLLVRPFLEDGRIVYRFPGSRVRYFLAARSRAFYAFTLGIERASALLARLGYLHTIEADMAIRGVGLAAFREALRTTESLVVRMKDRLGSVPLVAFQADQWFMNYWREVLARTHVPYIDAVPGRIRAAELAGVHVRYGDGAHWNAQGHAICAEVLTEQLRLLGLGPLGVGPTQRGAGR